jgi:hypothetical protein
MSFSLVSRPGQETGPSEDVDALALGEADDRALGVGALPDAERVRGACPGG